MTGHFAFLPFRVNLSILSLCFYQSWYSLGLKLLSHIKTDYFRNFQFKFLYHSAFSSVEHEDFNFLDVISTSVLLPFYSSHAQTCSNSFLFLLFIYIHAWKKCLVSLLFIFNWDSGFIKLKLSIYNMKIFFKKFSLFKILCCAKKIMLIKFNLFSFFPILVFRVTCSVVIFLH